MHRSKQHPIRSLYRPAQQREWPVRSRNLTPQIPWCGQCINDQSSVMPTDLTSALHRTISDLSSVPSSSGEDPPAA
jgi:hypothetical protein